MQVKDRYDLIVIGDQLSGLFLAAGAAQAGKRVLVLEESSVPTTLYEVPSGKLLGDFTAEPVVGLQEGSKIDEFLKSLGLYQEMSELFPLHEPPLQIVAPELRIDFSYKTDELRRELDREIVIEDETRSKMAQLFTGQTVGRKTFPQMVADISLPVEYEAFGNLQTTLYGAVSSAALPYVAYKEVTDLAARGVRYPSGGRTALKEHLLNRILVLGGSVKRATHVEEIVFERGKLAGVLLSSYEGFVRCQNVVGAMGTRTFFRLIPQELRPKRLSDSVQRIRPRYWRLSFTVLAHESVIPEGMGSHVALLDPEKGDDQENFLQIQVFPKSVYGGIPPHHKVIVVRMLVPFEEETVSPRFLSRMLKRALVRLETLIPFLREKPISVSPDPDRLEQDIVYQKFFRFKDLDHIPPIFLVYDGTFSQELNETADFDWGTYGLEGLAICSRDVRPLYGLVGEIMSAMDLLAKMERKERKRL